MNRYLDPWKDSPMVRIFHTSDWHLGRFLYGKSLLEDQEFILYRLIELLERERPHALLIAGDVFDRPFPPEAAVRLFDRFLSETISRLGVKIFLIPGNHDSCERLGFASQLLRDRDLTIFARVEDSLHPVCLKGDGQTEVFIYGIPFVEPPLIGRMLDRSDIRTPNEAISALTEEMRKRAPKGHLSVLLCHAFVVGGQTSESEKDIFIGGSAHVDVRSFEGFTYTALGHLHKPQKAGHDSVRYSGSLLPYSKSEADHTKSITEIRLFNEQGVSRVEYETHSLATLRGLRVIEGELEEMILQATTDPAREDYIVAGYTDKGPVLDAFARLRVVYPNLLHITRAGGFVPSDLPSAKGSKAEREAMNELDLFGAFFNDTTGSDLNAAEREFIAATLLGMRAEESDVGGELLT